MINNASVYALIPARGGSKGIKDKCITPLAGKPLITWTIEQAKTSQYIDRVIVSTDSQKIATIAAENGAEVPFLRPESIAQDDSPASLFIEHALGFFETEPSGIPDIIVILQPTSPLRTPQDVDNALEMLVKQNAKSVVSVYKPDISPYWFKKVDRNGYISDFITSENSYIRRQDTKDLFLLNGAIYAVYSKAFLSAKMIVGAETLAYEMPAERSVDIDSPLDLQLAETLLRVQ